MEGRALPADESTGSRCCAGRRLATVADRPVMARTAFISRGMLARGALTRASTPGTRPSWAEAWLLTSASMPEMPSGADPPKASCSCRAPLIMYLVPRCSLRRPASVSEVTKRPWASAAHRR